MAINKSLSSAQVDKFRNELASRITKANSAFREANAGYADIVLNLDDLAALVPFAARDKQRDISGDVDFAKLRTDYVLAGRDTTTLDLLTIRTEKAVPEDSKFKLSAYVGVKTYNADGTIRQIGYQDPEDSNPPLNRIISADGSKGMVLRKKGLMQLMTAEDIKKFVEGIVPSFEDYFVMFF